MSTFDRIDPALIDQFPKEHDGYPDGLRAEDTIDAMRDAGGDASREFPQSLWIERSDYDDVANDNDKHMTWAVNYTDRFTNQDPTHECTCHALVQNFEACRNRARGVRYPGPKRGEILPSSPKFGSVWYSALSVYAEANPGQWGGATMRGTLEIAIRRGILPDKLQPRDYGFAHALHGTSGKGCPTQSSGPWTSVNRFPAGWQDTAAAHKVQEVIFPESAEQIWSLVLNGFCVCVGRNGHAIPYKLANVREMLLGYVDSYEVIRWDSWNTVKAGVGGAYCIASVTTPDDWAKPAA